MAASELIRAMWKSSSGSSAKCMEGPGCAWKTGLVSPGSAGRKAREHARETGHTTWAVHRQIVQYRPEAPRA
jgi:hypothetical protein